MSKIVRICIVLPPFLTCIFVFLSPFMAFSIGEEEDLMSIKEEKGIKFSFGRKVVERKQASVIKKKFVPKGNLPPILIRKNMGVASTKRKNPIQFVELSPVNKSGMDVGDVFDCMINQDIKAYVGSVSPVRAEILSGDMKGMVFIGNATLDPKMRNIVVQFDTLRDLENNVKHKLKATLQNNRGGLGLKGTMHSHYWQYFFATVMSRAAEGYAQASVQRDRNLFGNYQEVPSTENAGKTAVAEAASSTANLISDRMKNSPEYMITKGPIRTKIFIMDTPKLSL